MTPLPPDLVFRTPLDRGVAWPKHRSALDACQDLQARSEDADGVSLWHGGSTEVLVTEQLILAVAGKPRRQVPHATWGRWSEPIGGAEIARLWLRDGPECVAQITSSFALVIFERRERRTHLAVDPFGLASLFWRVADGELWICTEQAPLVGIRPTPRLDRLALPDVFNLRFLSGSRTLWTDLNQVLPGTLVTVEEDQVRRTEMRRIRFEPQD